MKTTNALGGLTMVLLLIVTQAGAQTGLIEHLPLNGGGTALVGTSGTLVNEPVAAEDRFGTPSAALAFSGASQQYVSVAGGGGLDALQTGTISMYVKWTGPQLAGFSSNGNVVARQFDGRFSNDVVGLSTTNPATAHVTWQPYDSGTPAIIGSTIVGNGQWRHLAITFSSGSHRLYIDGVLDGSSSAFGTISNTPGIPLTIGAWTGDGHGYSTSVIDDFKVFNRVLTQAEIQALINSPPAANAGADRAVADRDASGLRTTVVLDGTASSDPDQAPLTYAWIQTGGPAVTLAGANTATPTFLAPDMSDHSNGEPQPIALTFGLTVSDGTFISTPDDVVITVKHENLPPTAMASAPATAAEGTPVTLDGSASTDGDQDPLSYLWTQLSGTPVNLPANATNDPTLDFTANVAAPHAVAGETLQFKLTVSDGIDSDSAALSVFIKNVNHAPMALADAAAPVFDNVGWVALSGSGTDPDGDSVSLRWQQVAGIPVTLNNANTATPSFIAPAVAPAQGSVTLTFQLIANDASALGDPEALDSAPAAVDVLVKHANRAPVADAGTEINAPEQTVVTLDGSGSYDPDDDPIIYTWQQTAGTLVALDTTDRVHPKFTSRDVGPDGERLTFRLIVSDTPSVGSGGSLSSAPSTVAVNVRYLNQAPVAVIRAPAAPVVDEGSVVILDGSQSFDPDGNPFTCSWSQTSGPPVSLSDATAARPTFIAPAVDRFGETVAFALQMTDQFGALSNVATTSVAVRNINHPPIADAGALQSVPEDTDVRLAGLGLDFDAEENPLLTFAWTQSAGPAVVLAGADTATPSFHAPIVTAGGDPLAKAVLKFTLKVTDPNNASASADTLVTVTNVDHSPLANAGGIYLANEADQNLRLDGTLSSDPDGDTLIFSWEQTAGPAVTLVNADTATPSFTAPLVSAAGATLKFQLTVNDGFGGTSSDIATVNIANRDDPPVLADPHPSLARLWPPNHALVQVAILGVVDANGHAAVTITGVTQDEATSGLGDGDTPIDAIINPDGTVLLRAERSGKGNGRVYHLHFTAANGQGTVSGVVKVSVPHSKASDSAIDGGELFDSTEQASQLKAKRALKLKKKDAARKG